jgi:ABC-type polysaccharide/polyol phosphate transport system ATPase subunit
MAAPTPAVRLEAVSKRFPLYGSPFRQMLGYVGLGARNVRSKLALDNISLAIGHGERVGVVGHNGSGKTTLLRLIIGHTRPTGGRVLVDGTVQALMQTGYGFYDDLTGQENIRHALVYNGLPAQAMAEAEADIVEFVELGEFIHHPLKTYSLGMRARLEFAVATTIQPDILVIDEVLGAGDGYFVSKCVQRMHRLVSNTTLLLVSHSLDQIREYCERVVWLDGGRLREDGPAVEVLDRYRRHMAGLSARLQAPSAPQPNEAAAGATHAALLAKVRQLFGIGAAGAERVVDFGYAGAAHPSVTMETGEALELRLTVEAARPVRPVVLGMSEHGAFVFELEGGVKLSAGRYEVALRNPRLGVGVGHYVLVPALRDTGSGRVVAIGESVLDLHMAASNWSEPPLVHLDGTWTTGAARTPIDGKVSAWV